MRKVFIPVLAVLALAGAFLAARQDAQAAALNESNLPEEADFCDVQFPASAQLNAGEDLQLIGTIFEAGVTQNPGENAAILAEVGFGPIGTDPRFDNGWTYSAGSFDGDVGSDDEYHGTITAPSTAVTTDYAYTFRFSLDGGIDFTYCDLDGAGSNGGLDFSPGELGTLTVNGTGVGEGSADGSVTTSVDVIADPGACILLDTATLDYGELTFSTQSGSQGGAGTVTITSCSLTTPLDVFAKGTNATGATANWALTTPPGSNNMCDTAEAGIDQFGQRLIHGQTLNPLDLTLTNQAYAAGLGVGQSLLTGVDMFMPCSGSSGSGETVSSTVTFTAVPGTPPPDDNPCAVEIPFLAEGTTQGDTTSCLSFPGAEINPSCLDGAGALHRQYFAFQVPSGSTATVAVDSAWDAVVALYEINENTNTADEVDCSNNVNLNGTEIVSHQNSNPAATTYIVQVEGVTNIDVGGYEITLAITP